MEGAMTPQGYNWEGKEEICRAMYVAQGKSLEQIAAWFFATEGWQPSTRTLQAQFEKKWQFPPKVEPLTGLRLEKRIKELWETNTSQKDMLRILLVEGAGITERELSKLRKKNGFALRTANGMKSRTTGLSPGSGDGFPVLPMYDTTPEVLAKRQEVQRRLQAESDKRLAAKTRRVRTRKYGTLDADPPMPPRFPSEMTIGQSKTMLQLSQDEYVRMRTRFQDMCEAENITKKSLDLKKWVEVKDQLINETPHLADVIRIQTPDDTSLKLKKDRVMALDIICCDVTKKIRTAKTRITIPEAKTRLGVNPSQANDIRRIFYDILRTNHFTSKMEAGQELWESMKLDLINKSPVLQNIMRPPGGLDVATSNDKKKALEVICRDIMKRLRDDSTKLGKLGKASRLTPTSNQSPKSEAKSPTKQNFDVDSKVNAHGPPLNEIFNLDNFDSPFGTHADSSQYNLQSHPGQSTDDDTRHLWKPLVSQPNRYSTEFHPYRSPSHNYLRQSNNDDTGRSNLPYFSAPGRQFEEHPESLIHNPPSHDYPRQSNNDDTGRSNLPYFSAPGRQFEEHPESLIHNPPSHYLGHSVNDDLGFQPCDVPSHYSGQSVNEYIDFQPPDAPSNHSGQLVNDRFGFESQDAPPTHYSGQSANDHPNMLNQYAPSHHPDLSANDDAGSLISHSLTAPPANMVPNSSHQSKRDIQLDPAIDPSLQFDDKSTLRHANKHRSSILPTSSASCSLSDDLSRKDDCGFFVADISRIKLQNPTWRHTISANPTMDEIRDIAFKHHKDTNLWVKKMEVRSQGTPLVTVEYDDELREILSKNRIDTRFYLYFELVKEKHDSKEQTGI